MNAPLDTHAGALRFERVVITCVFGDPRDLKSWSGAPANLAKELERLGVACRCNAGIPCHVFGDDRDIAGVSGFD